MEQWQDKISIYKYVHFENFVNSVKKFFIHELTQIITKISVNFVDKMNY
jgi:hypothetical protein